MSLVQDTLKGSIRIFINFRKPKSYFKMMSVYPFYVKISFVIDGLT